MDWRAEYRSKLTTAEAAVASAVKSGDRLFLTGNCSVPMSLVAALVAHAPCVENVELAQVLTIGPAPWAAASLAPHLRSNVMFIGRSLRPAVWERRADFTPVLLSEFPLLFKRGGLPLDVALAHVSPPDENGYCSFGLETGLAKTPVTSAKTVIAQVNAHMPYIHGDTLIHVSELDYLVEVDAPLQSYRMAEDLGDPTVEAIAQYIVDLIPDGATLQMGIGAVPDTVLHYLETKRDLGVHTELFSDGVKHLVERGVITGVRKTLHPGKITAGFVLGSESLYRWLDHNPLVELYPTEYVNDPCVIGRNYRQVAINSAIQVDLTGQVCADSIGPRFFSGVGGQLDFIYGASRSDGGIAIIALPSTAKQGTLSRIVPTLAPGAGVVTTRNHVHWVITEHGAVDLYGRSIRERVHGLIGIAHPQFRESLMREARNLGYI
ncbi:MAG: acetyl-CoA hydrolase/transferase family protein [Anaerolineae bacterium]|nr:acetyl-CoA hydrolase/transferase family protein [Anaerolineae bacterium]